MRFKQRLRVIQTIEDTTKRNVVRILRPPKVTRLSGLFHFDSVWFYLIDFLLIVCSRSGPSSRRRPLVSMSWRSSTCSLRSALIVVLGPQNNFINRNCSINQSTFICSTGNYNSLVELKASLVGNPTSLLFFICHFYTKYLNIYLLSIIFYNIVVIIVFCFLGHSFLVQCGELKWFSRKEKKKKMAAQMKTSLWYIHEHHIHLIPKKWNE